MPAYIELSPVRAGMVDDPAHCCWTSYRANALGRSDASVVSHAVYPALGRNDAERRAACRALFRAELDASAIGDLRLALNQNQPVGNTRFLAGGAGHGRAAPGASAGPAARRARGDSRRRSAS